jgi:hypothetical protein
MADCITIYPKVMLNITLGYIVIQSATITKKRVGERKNNEIPYFIIFPILDNNLALINT